METGETYEYLDEATGADGNGPERPQEATGGANASFVAGDTDTRVCAALLVAKDISEAARLAGVSRPTVYARLKDPAFMDRLERERAALLEDVRGAISDAMAQAARDALDALASIARGEPAPGWLGMDYPSATERVKAASEILSLYERQGA